MKQRQGQVAVVETATGEVWDLCPDYRTAWASAVTLCTMLGEAFHCRVATGTTR